MKVSRQSDRSIDVTRDEDNYSDIDEAAELAMDQMGSQQAKSAWEMGGVHRDHVIQNLLYLGGQLGFYRHVAVEGGGQQPVQEERVFYRGIYAPDEVDAIRRSVALILTCLSMHLYAQWLNDLFVYLSRLLIDQDDPVERQLTVYVASINMVPQFLVPLFYQAVDEK